MGSDSSVDEPTGNSPWGGPSRRGGKVRKRDDYGVALFRQALDSFPDGPHLRHALLELNRAYNPVANAPILDSATRRRIIDLVEGARAEEARQILEECFSAYARRGAEKMDVRQESPGTSFA